MPYLKDRENYTPITGKIGVQVSKEEWDAKKVGSLFVDKECDVTVEMALPMWKEEGRIISFPYLIISEGQYKDIEDEITALVSTENDAYFKVKEVVEFALKIKTEVIKDKKTGISTIQFDPSEIPGKQCMISYRKQKSKKDPDRFFIVPARAYPINAKVEETN